MLCTFARRKATNTSNRLNTSLKLCPASLSRERLSCHKPTPASMSTKRTFSTIEKIKMPFNDCVGAVW